MRMGDAERKEWSIGRARKHVAPQSIDYDALVKPRGRHPSERGALESWGEGSRPFANYENDDPVDAYAIDEVTWME